MTKRAIIYWWIWGLIAFAPGAILIPSSALALATYNQGVNDAYGRTMVALIAAGGLFALAGVAAWLMGWVAAVLNTHRLADPRWFQVLLWGGIAGILTTPLADLGALVFASDLQHPPAQRQDVVQRPAVERGGRGGDHAAVRPRQPIRGLGDALWSD